MVHLLCASRHEATALTARAPEPNPGLFVCRKTVILRAARKVDRPIPSVGCVDRGSISGERVACVRLGSRLAAAKPPWAYGDRVQRAEHARVALHFTLSRDAAGAASPCCKPSVASDGPGGCGGRSACDLDRAMASPRPDHSGAADRRSASGAFTPLHAHLTWFSRVPVLMAWHGLMPLGEGRQLQQRNTASIP